jgi:pilus assembly protein FimV
MANASTITVNAGDTLWEIALRVRPDSSVSVQQTMLALQRLNPGAFINNNINQVRRGEVLRVPEFNEIRQLSVNEAVAEVARQNQAQQLAAITPAQPVSQTPATAPPGAGTQGELRVVTVDEASDQRPDTSAAGDQSAQTRQQLQNIENQLAARQEDLDRQAAQNDELNARLGMLQQQIASAQEIIRLRDLELAQLQQSLAEQVPATAAPAPTIITMAPDAGPVERLINTMLSNTWALLLGALALILALVLILAKRNKTAREREPADQRDVDDMPLGDDSDDLMFSGVAAAAADSAAEQAANGPDADDVDVESDPDVENDPDAADFNHTDNFALAAEGNEELGDLAFIPSEDSLTEEDDEEDEDDFAFLSDSDEAATKLDLARAYIDMGDMDGAGEILNEVLQQGTEIQRREAQVLLGRL